MKYNKALDYLIVASQEFKRGNLVNAARIFAAAQAHPSMADAVRIIEANNLAAFKKERPRLAASITRRLKAENEAAEPETEIEDDLEIESTDENVEEILRTLDDGAEDGEDADEDEAEADDVEASEDEESEDDEMTDAEVEAIVARMRASKKKTTARRVSASKNTFAKVLKSIKG